jgi:hypothetical protein
MGWWYPLLQWIVDHLHPPPFFYWLIVVYTWIGWQQRNGESWCKASRRKKFSRSYVPFVRLGAYPTRFVLLSSVMLPMSVVSMVLGGRAESFGSHIVARWYSAWYGGERGEQRAVRVCVRRRCPNLNYHGTWKIRPPPTPFFATEVPVIPKFSWGAAFVVFEREPG